MSIIEISARNIPQAYTEGLWKFRIMARQEDTRNGPAMVLPAPVFLTIQFPEERLLNCPVRRANPFFHCMGAEYAVPAFENLLFLIVDHAAIGIVKTRLPRLVFPEEGIVLVFVNSAHGKV